MKKISLLGAPGSGKGTFSKLMTQSMKKWKHLSIGETFREEIKLESKVGLTVSSYLNSGQLVPNNIVDECMISKLTQFSQENKYDIILLDGYPRTIDQCKYLYDYDIKNNLIQTKALLIDVPEWIIIDKLLGRRICTTCNGDFNICDIRHDTYDMPPILPDFKKCIFGPDKCQPNLLSRSDDTKEIIQRRLSTYNQKIHSIMEFYKNQNLFYSFNVKKGVSETNKLIELIVSITNER